MKIPGTIINDDKTLMSEAKATVLAEHLNKTETDGTTYKTVPIGPANGFAIAVYDEIGKFVFFL